MTDEPEYTHVAVSGPGAVEVDTEIIARIIFDTCHTSEQRATRAANKVVDYLIGVHQNPTKPS